MASYGDYRRNKFVHGENKLAQALGKCLFDYVFVFPETTEFVRMMTIAGEGEVSVPDKREPGDQLSEDSYQRKVAL
jgi:hypothetical protein